MKPRHTYIIKSLDLARRWQTKNWSNGYLFVLPLYWLSQCACDRQRQLPRPKNTWVLGKQQKRPARTIILNRCLGNMQFYYNLIPFTRFSFSFCTFLLYYFFAHFLYIFLLSTFILIFLSFVKRLQSDRWKLMCFKLFYTRERFLMFL